MFCMNFKKVSVSNNLSEMCSRTAKYLFFLLHLDDSYVIFLVFSMLKWALFSLHSNLRNEVKGQLF